MSKGGDKVISVYWFVILFIVAAAVVYMVFLFYGKPYDVRAVEANLLLNKVSDCFFVNGYLNENVFDEGFGIVDCGITFSVGDYSAWEDDQFYVRVNVLDELNGEVVKRFEEGNDFLSSCSEELNNQPFCVERGFYVLGSGGEDYIIAIKSVVNKVDKNV